MRSRGDSTERRASAGWATPTSSSRSRSIRTSRAGASARCSSNNLLEGRLESTCVLSTRTDSRAYELYSRLGFEVVKEMGVHAGGRTVLCDGEGLGLMGLWCGLKSCSRYNDMSTLLIEAEVREMFGDLEERALESLEAFPRGARIFSAHYDRCSRLITTTSGSPSTRMTSTQPTWSRQIAPRN